MKIPVTSCFLLALAGLASADLPKKQPLQTYSVLWNNSPFTSKPPPPPPGETVNPLEDYALIGVSPIGGDQYRVTMINKKKPDERIMVFSDSTTSDFKILGVTRKAGDPLGTEVKMSSGSSTGTVKYEEKLLTLATPAPPKPQVAKPGQPPMPGQVPQLQPGQQRQPRPRVVPPPTPGVQPGVQPVQKSQQAPQFQGGGRGQSQSSQSQRNFSRPERRRN